MIYTTLLTLHNLNRWLVLVAAIWALAHAWRGLLTRSTWSKRDDLPGRAFTGILKLQFVLGVCLYLASSITKPVFGNLAYMFSGDVVRFFTLEHPLQMFIAVGIADAGYTLSRRATADRSRFRRAAIGYTLAILLILAAIPWPSLPHGRPLLPGGF